MPFLQLQNALPGHSDPAWSVTFNPSRSLLASCSTDKTVRLFSYILSQSPSSTPSTSTFPTSDSPKPSFSLASTIQTSHKRTVRSIAWAPSGRTLATASFDSTVGVWEEVAEYDDDGSGGVHRPEEDGMGEGGQGGGGVEGKEWECMTTLEGHDSECKGVGFSSDGGLLASCSRDKSVWVWEVQPDADFECIAVMMDHAQDVKCLAWHPHEEILASASYDSHIHLFFDDPDGDWCAFQKLHPHLPVSPFTIHSPSPSLVSNLKEPEAGRLEVPPLLEDETVWCLAWSPCGRYLASGGDLGGIRIWSRQGNQPDSKFVETLHTAAHSRSCFSVSWSPGGLPADQGGLGLLASGGGDGKIIIWQISLPPPAEGLSNGDEKPRARIAPIAGMRDAHGVSDVNSVAWCLREDGKGLGMLASAGDDGGVRVWRVVSDD